MKLHGLLKLAVPLVLVMSLAGCPGNDDEENGNSAGTTQEAVGSQVVGGDMLTTWPTGEEVVDVPIADNVYGKNYVISIDVSGSMDGRCDGEYKIVAAKAAATEFLSSIPSDAAVGLSIFGSRVGMLVPLAHNNHTAVADAIAALQADGGTPMAAAIEASYEALTQAGSAQLGYGEYNLVVLGDGAPSSERATRQWLDRLALETPVRVTTIGFCADISVLDRTGVNYQPASNVEELRAAFQSVLAEAATFNDGQF